MALWLGEQTYQSAILYLVGLGKPVPYIAQSRERCLDIALQCLHRPVVSLRRKIAFPRKAMVRTTPCGVNLREESLGGPEQNRHNFTGPLQKLLALASSSCFVLLATLALTF